MFVTIVDDRVHVTLSRRNLRQLAAIIDDPECPHMCLARRDERGLSIFVHAQSDADHYDERAPEAQMRTG
jgi:hypothetical protein